MRKPSLAAESGLSVYELRQSYLQQLPTVAALIYTAGDDIEPDDAADAAVDLIDAVLARLADEEAD